LLIADRVDIVASGGGRSPAVGGEDSVDAARFVEIMRTI
jgi:hypothetical protein